MHGEASLVDLLQLEGRIILSDSQESSAQWLETTEQQKYAGYGDSETATPVSVASLMKKL
jgi:hypothetical protein